MSKTYYVPKENELENFIAAHDHLKNVSDYGWTRWSKLLVDLGWDKKLFQLKGNRRIRIKKMSRLTKRILFENFLQYADTVIKEK